MIARERTGCFRAVAVGDSPAPWWGSRCWPSARSSRPGSWTCSCRDCPRGSRPAPFGHATIQRIRGDVHLDAVEIVHETTGQERVVDTPVVFSFIGALRRTDWLPPEIERGARGFIRTGAGLVQSSPWTSRRQPFLLQTSRPGVFAAGDVRSGSVKRVASAVGEGAMVVQFVHEVLEEVQGPEDRQIQGRRSCPPRSDGAPRTSGLPRPWHHGAELLDGEDTEHDEGRHGRQLRDKERRLGLRRRQPVQGRHLLERPGRPGRRRSGRARARRPSRRSRARFPRVAGHRAPRSRRAAPPAR